MSPKRDDFLLVSGVHIVRNITLVEHISLTKIIQGGEDGAVCGIFATYC